MPTAQPRKGHFMGRLRGDGSKKLVWLTGYTDTVGVASLQSELEMIIGTLLEVAANKENGHNQ